MKIKQFLRLSAALVLSLSSLLTLAVPMAHAVTHTCTWTGATSNLFSVPTNWSNCGGDHPEAGDSLVFPYGASVSAKTVDNDLTDNTTPTAFANITFSGTRDNSEGNYSITDNDMAITGGIVDSSNYLETINVNLALSGASGGNQTLQVDGTSILELRHVVSGSDDLTKTGTGELLLEGNNTFSGNLVANAGSVVTDSATALGTTAGSTTINSGADLDLADCNDDPATVAENLTLNGASSDPSSSFPTPKLTTDAGTCGGTSGYTEMYGGVPADGGTMTLSGSLALGSDITFGSIAATTNLTGALSGGFAINLLSGYSGKLVINGSANGLTSANGSYTPTTFTKTLSDSQPSNSVYIQGNSVVTIDGTRGDTTVDNGGTLKGDGTVGSLTVFNGGIVSPGHSPGCLNSGDLTMTGIYQAEIGGVMACSGYDQLNVTGDVDVTGATLTPSIVDGFTPSVGQSFTVISNDSNDPVTGTFANQAEGSTITVTGVTFKVTYAGGDGNDVVLTVTAVDSAKLPTAPKTGLAAVAAHPLVTLFVSSCAAALLVFAARRAKPSRR